ncbi:MAG: DUF378 domain-containing protein [Bacilli bacterium]|nr:DUF378 domain-containing protein [Bacillales bacterium]MDY2574938.1 DUF378 domain-containing protein [Bacilli bacterium]
MNIFQKICLLFTIIGGINWGLIGLFDFNLVTWITQGENMASRVIYTVISLCAIINILIFFYRLAPMKKEDEIR